MNRGLIKNVSWLGIDYLDGPARALVVNFHGLGHNELKKSPSAEEYCWSKAGALVLFPYYGPWSWMNREARTFVDELISAVLSENNLPSNLPVIAAGDSMGGCSALLFARYTKHNVSAVSALYPVCDLEFHYSERPDVPRSIHAAFRSYPQSLSSILAEHSPLSQVGHMPNVAYLVVHSAMDREVNKKAHSDAFVSAMRTHGMQIEYLEVEDLRHGGPFPEPVIRRRIEFVAEQMTKGYEGAD